MIDGPDIVSELITIPSDPIAIVDAVTIPLKYPSVADKTPKVLTPETLSAVTEAIPPITFVEIPELSA
jgi:hypothetical protein